MTEIKNTSVIDFEDVSDDQMNALIDGTLTDFDEGDLVDGTVVKIERDEVLVDIGFKSEGVIPARERSIRKDADPADIVALGDAIEAVNIVRRRGFGDSEHDLSAGLSREELRGAIRKERAYELCFEGHRKQDLIRWGIYFKTIRQTAQELQDWYENANYAVNRYTIEGRHELMPIPQRDLDLMPKVKQNPGWGL